MSSLVARLTFAFFACALGAVGLGAAAVLPGLESRLVDAKLGDLEATARQYGPSLRRSVGTNESSRRLEALVGRTADLSGVRVTVLLTVRSPDAGVEVTPTADSTSERDIGLNFPAALQAAQTGRTATATEAGTTGRIGQAAVPFSFPDPETGRAEVGRVAVFSTPLRDVEASVAAVRNRALLAAATALGITLISGFLVARALARRVKRLERGARRVAEGDFTARFGAEGGDELGDLARTLDAMRGQLEELDSARKRFIATASHELRTPIFSLGGFLELLADEELDEDTRAAFLVHVRAQVDRLGKLATDLLDLSKLEAGSMELRPEPIDLGLLARRVADEFIPRLTAHDSHLELRLPAEPVGGMCDPERVAQVVRILIDNALTHTPAGTDVVLTAGRRDGRVRVGVGDFGPGIHRSMLPKIFEPFVTSDDAQGSGLGLAIAHELAGRMAGELVVESHPGRTTFTLELPA